MADWLAGALIAFAVATITTPAGVSGAVFLLPVQVSVLHVANPALTPTNLLYNVLATPGALLRRRPEGGFATVLLRGTVPGVVLGAVLRVEVFDALDVFLLVIAAVLAPVGVWLLVGRPPAAARSGVPGARETAIAFAAGVVGGIYGIGGGSLLGPALVLLGWQMAAVAPAALAATFVTSCAGVLAFQVLELVHGDGAIAPEWGLGLAMGLGGLAGGYLGTRLAPRVPEVALRRLLGVVCLVLAGRYAVFA